MGRWVPRFVCPECRSALAAVADTVIAPDRFLCHSCGVTFESEGGVYRFLTPARAAAAARFNEQYRAVRAREGHASSSAEYYRQLPVVAGSNAQAGQWRVRRESLAHLQRYLAAAAARTRPARIADIGAGNGWLSNRLASHGHEVVAVDRLADQADGLGAIRHYAVAMVAVQADFDALPFAPGQFDVVVFNGSLHYSKDPAATLAEARRVLKPGGAVAVMDSPMFRGEADGLAMLSEQLKRLREQHGVAEPLPAGVGFLTYEMLDGAAAALGVGARFIRSRGPLTWRLRRQMARLRLGRAPAAFGVWVAQ